MKQRILAIESSATVCSVAVCEEEKVLAYREIGGGYHHAALLTTFVQEVLEESGSDTASLHAVAVSKGPGSYTGLRIGISVAKGICFSKNIPLIGISSLEAMALAVARQYTSTDMLITMLDAGRMEVYTMTWNGNMELLEPLKARVIEADSFDHLTDSSKIVLIGTGAGKLRDLLSHHTAIIFRDEIYPTAQLLVVPALKALKEQRFDDVAYFEPLYLKEFVAGKPRVKGLR
jgi:tRNA threonylcarbamoyladenosine biosynthesis protein TsaB